MAIKIAMAVKIAMAIKIAMAVSINKKESTNYEGSNCMNVAVFSDIHGNYVAFQTCVEYALKRKINTFIFLGDYLGEFPYPQRTMEILYSMKKKYKCFFIRGNKEDYWINRKKDVNCEWKDGNESVGAMKYCYANLTAKDIDFFSNLSISKEICFAGMEPLLVCHGSPRKNNEKIILNSDNTKEIMEKCEQKYILCGHTHIQQMMEYGEKVVLNPGAVGVSLYAQGKTQFMILHAEADGWKHEFIQLNYNKESVIDEIQESELMELAPYWSQITIQLIKTGSVAHGTVLARAMKYGIEEMGECKWYDVPEKYWEKAIRELISTDFMNVVTKKDD